MPRRRGSSQDDGLELLLDTVCNVFGGIMFIAILVALLTSVRSSTVDKDERSIEQQISARAEADRLRSKLEAYKQGLSDLKETRGLLSDEKNERALQVVRRFEAARQKAEERLESARTWVQKRKALEEKVQKRLQSLNEQLQEVRQRVDELKKSLEGLKETNRVQVRLPLERQTYKEQVYLLLDGNKGYLVPVSAGKRAVPEDGPAVRMVRPEPGRSNVWPREGRGFVVPPDGESPRLRELIETYDPGSHFFELAVLPDAARTFRRVRDAVTEAGYEYNIHPKEELPLKLFTTHRQPSVQ